MVHSTTCAVACAAQGDNAGMTATDTQKNTVRTMRWLPEGAQRLRAGVRAHTCRITCWL